jgi:glycosyltransferase involved in cell wall biosynthesis
MKFSIAISSFNRLEYLKKCLDSLFTSLASCSDFEIVIVDSSTKEEVKKFLGGLKEVLIVHKEFEEHGEAQTHNLKFERSTGKFVFHCCDDYVISNQQKRDWLSDFEEIFELDSNIGVISNEKVRNSGWKYPEHRIHWDMLPKKKSGSLEYVVLQNPYRVNFPVVGWMYRKSILNIIGEFIGQGYKNNLPVDWNHTKSLLDNSISFVAVLNSACTLHIGDERCYQ